MPLTAENSGGNAKPAYYVVALAMAIPALLFGLLLGGSRFAVSALMAGGVDFRQLYAAGYMVRTGHGHELYDYQGQQYFQNKVVSPGLFPLPYIRPAYQALLFAPLTFVSFRVAYALWFLLNVLLLFLCLRLLRPWTENLRAVWGLLPVAIALGFIPLGFAFMQGQDSILLLVLASATLVLLKRRKTFSGGAMLAMGLFKLQLVLFKRNSLKAEL